VYAFEPVLIPAVKPGKQFREQVPRGCNFKAVGETVILEDLSFRQNPVGGSETLVNSGKIRTSRGF
jgi:hypothetical protein